MAGHSSRSCQWHLRIPKRLAPSWEIISCLWAVALLTGWTEQPLRAADPYATALDKRFESNQVSAQPPPEPGTAALEKALKEQVRQMSTRPEPLAPVKESQTRSWLILLAVMAGGVFFGLMSLLVLRKWNQRIDAEAAKRISALADDPLMAEFLRVLHEDPVLNPISVSKPAEEPPQAPPAKIEPTPAAQPPPAIPEPSTPTAALRAEFKKLGLANTDGERKQVLCDLLVRAEAVKEQANQKAGRLLASALHGLFNQLSIKPQNTTASVLRTAASAIDLLERLTTENVRPDLFTTPPVRLLAVDDDAICRRAVSLALKKAFTEPDVAADGKAALALAEAQPYDVIFLDIEMPGMDGFELCAKIRETKTNGTTPIVFVTSHTDFDSRAKSAKLRANELIGKPFLAFEITVKALALVLKRRQEAESRRPCKKGEVSPGLKPAQVEFKGNTKMTSAASGAAECVKTTPNA